jgi:hypothetical protein
MQKRQLRGRTPKSGFAAVQRRAECSKLSSATTKDGLTPRSPCARTNSCLSTTIWLKWGELALSILNLES